VDLKRTDEAVAHSRALVAKYPQSHFALDVARHMLTHPMRDPAEVGYAKDR
jgi:outer membrane protein assembly factor BamD (BamD/ComL family)